jgi:hypothetical protein
VAVPTGLVAAALTKLRSQNEDARPDQ